jgi:hypothetical protein
MSSKVLPQGSTLRSIERSLSVEYLSEVLKNVWQCEDKMGDAVVSLDLRINSRCPDYNVYSVMDADTGQGMHWQSFSGSTHKPLTDDREKRAVWSAETMTCQEVRELLLAKRKSAKR